MKLLFLFLFLFSLSSLAQSPDSTWAQLMKKGGCLLGAQYNFTTSPKTSGDIPVIDTKEWIRFQNIESKVLIPFLINKLSDTSQTNIHTCPCYQATEGEIAVYILERKIQNHWYELPGFEKYQKKKESGCSKNKQKWLQGILQKKKKRKNLEDAFIIKLKS